MKGDSLGHCDYHEKHIDIKEFEWKGCWTCPYFIPTNFPYVDVDEAARVLEVSESTVRRWIKKGKLKGRLFKRGRRNTSPAPKKYFIKLQSVDKFKQSRAKAGDYSSSNNHPSV